MDETGVTTLLTVNQMLRLEPATAAVFNRLGIDTCCGGNRTLGQAAESAGLPAAALLAALRPLMIEVDA